MLVSRDLSIATASTFMCVVGVIYDFCIFPPLTVSVNLFPCQKCSFPPMTLAVMYVTICILFRTVPQLHSGLL